MREKCITNHLIFFHCTMNILLLSSFETDRFFTTCTLVGENVNKTIKNKIKTAKIKSKIEVSLAIEK